MRALSAQMCWPIDLPGLDGDGIALAPSFTANWETRPKPKVEIAVCGAICSRLPMPKGVGRAGWRHVFDRAHSPPHEHQDVVHGVLQADLRPSPVGALGLPWRDVPASPHSPIAGSPHEKWKREAGGHGVSEACSQCHLQCHRPRLASDLLAKMLFLAGRAQHESSSSVKPARGSQLTVRP